MVLGILPMLLLAASPPAQPGGQLTQPGGQLTQPLGDATVAWQARGLTALGVGTPRILSPTGGLLERDALALAQDDARLRLHRAVSALPLPDGNLFKDDPRAAPLLTRVAGAVTFGEPRYFSDGTAHLPGSLSLDAFLGVKAPPGGPTLRLRAPTGFVPCLEVRVEREGAGAALLAGLPGDPIAYVVWRSVGSPTEPAPPQSTAPGRCVLRLPADAPATASPASLEIQVPQGP